MGQRSQSSPNCFLMFSGNGIQTVLGETREGGFSRLNLSMMATATRSSKLPVQTPCSPFHHVLGAGDYVPDMCSDSIRVMLTSRSSSGGNISTRRQAEYPHTANPLMGANLW